MKVRRAIIKDLKRVQDLYGIVSDEMAGTIYEEKGYLSFKKRNRQRYSSS
mgnify:CR=1 FL=1